MRGNCPQGWLLRSSASWGGLHQHLPQITILGVSWQCFLPGKGGDPRRRGGSTPLSLSSRPLLSRTSILVVYNLPGSSGEQAACESLGANGFKNKPRRQRRAAAEPPDFGRITLCAAQTGPWVPTLGTIPVLWDLPGHTCVSAHSCMHMCVLAAICTCLHAYGCLQTRALMRMLAHVCTCTHTPMQERAQTHSHANAKACNSGTCLHVLAHVCAP